MAMEYSVSFELRDKDGNPIIVTAYYKIVLKSKILTLTRWEERSP